MLGFDAVHEYQLIMFNSMFFYFSIVFAAIPGLLVDVFDKKRLK